LYLTVYIIGTVVSITSICHCKYYLSSWISSSGPCARAVFDLLPGFNHQFHLPRSTLWYEARC